MDIRTIIVRNNSGKAMDSKVRETSMATKIAFVTYSLKAKQTDSYTFWLVGYSSDKVFKSCNMALNKTLAT
jgi:hypothetical protein